MNSLAIHDALAEWLGSGTAFKPGRLPMQPIAEPYSRSEAIQHLTADMWSFLRQAQDILSLPQIRRQRCEPWRVGAEIILKATKVDGELSPPTLMRDPTATRFDQTHVP